MRFRSLRQFEHIIGFSPATSTGWIPRRWPGWLLMAAMAVHGSNRPLSDLLLDGQASGFGVHLQQCYNLSCPVLQAPVPDQ